MMATMTMPVAIAPRIADEVRGQSLPTSMTMSGMTTTTPPGTWRMRRRMYTPPPSSSPSPPMSATSTSTNKIVGHAHLCFCEDGSWFEGHLIATTDESQYGLVGKKRASSSSSDVEDSTETNLDKMYDVSVLDHDAGDTYAVRSVVLTTTDDLDRRLCSLVSSGLFFGAQQSFRGQMADMLIQRYLTPRLVGKQLRVYAGQMSVDLELLENLDSPSEKRMWYN